MNVKKTVEAIKSLEIQGARNVTMAAVKAAVEELKTGGVEKAKKAVEELIGARPTEPMMRNYLYQFVKEMGEDRKKAEKFYERVEEEMAENLEKIVRYGVNTLEGFNTVLTHCHSSTVTSILKKAGVSVICTETRPKWQGRKTAKELAEAGVKTTLIVDFAIKRVMKEVDAVLVGADAVSARGNLINKVGTEIIAFVASEYNVPFYSAFESSKFDPATIWGTHEAIEKREEGEVVGDDKELIKLVRTGKLFVRNPAFGITYAKYVSAYITELGVLKPEVFVTKCMERYL